MFFKILWGFFVVDVSISNISENIYFPRLSSAAYIMEGKLCWLQIQGDL